MAEIGRFEIAITSLPRFLNLRPKSAASKSLNASGADHEHPHTH
ncbi:hypothetical protein [Sphingobium sp.]